MAITRRLLPQRFRVGVALFPVAVIRTALRIAACTLPLLLASSTASAQVIITVSENVNFRLGVLGQFWADTIKVPAVDDYSSNLFARRLRLLFGGQVTKNVTFFVETDTPNLGRTVAPGGKNITPATIIQDAYATYKVSDAFGLDAGLMFVPFSRNSVQSAASLLPIDYGTYTFTQSAPTQSSTGRDAGFQARGYFLANRLEYRAGVFQGRRDALSRNAFRFLGRLQYNVFDPETAFFYTGTYLGTKKKVLAFGGAVDSQEDFRAYAGDVFADIPAGPGAITGQFDYNRFDGKTTFPTLPKQDDYLAEAGYFIRAWKLQPVVQYVRRDIVDTSVGDEWRLSVGANWWFASYNANIKGAYTRIDASGLPIQHEYTIQFQLFYF